MKPTSLSPTIFGSSIALAALLALTGCRFNPQAAQRLAERGYGNAPRATVAALTEPTGAAAAVAATTSNGAVAPAPDTLPPTTTPVAQMTTAATPAAAATAAAAAAPPAPTPALIVANGGVTTTAALTTSTFIPAVNAGESVAATQASAQSAAPAVEAADDVVVADPATSADITQPKVVAKRPKATVRRARVTAPRRAARSVCTISTRATVNLRALPTTRSRRMAVLRPRARFVAVARSANSRWVYGVSSRGRGWVSSATVRCVSAPRALTVRR